MPHEYIRKYFNNIKEHNHLDMSNPALKYMQRVRMTTMQIATDTFLLHDYFLFYSPVLLAATAVYLSFREFLKQFKVPKEDE